MPTHFSAVRADCIFLNMKGSLGLTLIPIRYSLCKVKSLHHFTILVETVNQQMHEDCVKRENYQRIQQKFCFVFSFQFFLTNVMHIISVTDFPLFCSNFARKCLILPAECSFQNRLFCSKFCRQNLSKPTTGTSTTVGPSHWANHKSPEWRTTNQSEFDTKPGNRCQARENTRKHLQQSHSRIWSTTSHRNGAQRTNQNSIQKLATGVKRGKTHGRQV